MTLQTINGTEYDIKPFADLTGANLRGANLRGANLFRANLRGANLFRADLFRADLFRADLTGADLRGADLTGADLRGADLRGADLRGADLRGANLDAIKHDVWAILAQFPHEVAGLRQALVEGRVNGSVYTGECACLIGTIANLRHCSYQALSITPDSDRPAERWFLGISQGHTPDADHPIAAITLDWVDEWLALPVVRMALAGQPV